jgi:hypothetical protein
MLIFPNALFARATAADGPPAAAALDLDFAAGSYRAGGTLYPSLAAMPGYAFARSGEQGAADTDGSVDWFAANVPAINGRGFHAYAAATNHLPSSQSLASLALLGAGTGSAPVRTLDYGAAPDGLPNASRFQFNRGAGTSGSDYSVATLLSTATVTGGQAWTESVWARAVSGTQKVTLYFGGGNFAFEPVPFTLTTSWQRLAISQVALSTGSGANFGIGLIGTDGSGAQSADIVAWQGQFVPGGFADGGPLIRTASSSATIAASALSLGLANGMYRATYTFDDGSSQVVPVTVSGGTFNHPTLGVLERAIVKRTLVEIA